MFFLGQKIVSGLPFLQGLFFLNPPFVFIFDTSNGSSVVGMNG